MVCESPGGCSSPSFAIFSDVFAYRGSKAFQTFLIFMSLHEGNPLKRSYMDDFDRFCGRLGMITGRPYDRFVVNRAGTLHIRL